MQFFWATKCGPVRNFSPAIVKAAERGNDIESLIRITDVNSRDCVSYQTYNFLANYNSDVATAIRLYVFSRMDLQH